MISYGKSWNLPPRVPRVQQWWNGAYTLKFSGQNPFMGSLKRPRVRLSNKKTPLKSRAFQKQTRLLFYEARDREHVFGDREGQWKMTICDREQHILKESIAKAGSFSRLQKIWDPGTRKLRPIFRILIGPSGFIRNLVYTNHIFK